MPEHSDHDDIIAAFDQSRHNLSIFMEAVAAYIGRHPDLVVAGAEVVHSFKSRLKDKEHLRAKIVRKNANGAGIDAENLFSLVTDLAGVRVLHLFQEGFGAIDNVIRQKIAQEDWVLRERAKAYTWDPEAASYFGSFDLDVSQKPTSYTSVHYLVSPRPGSPICCEVQVRTLFEEIWGEVDHRINYPTPTTSIACREQIQVLSKIVGAGSRLLDALQRVYQAEQ
jgi:ppGpp synthetase/RelA/SpoT-type nucleotidyltranferase